MVADLSEAQMPRTLTVNVAENPATYRRSRPPNALRPQRLEECDALLVPILALHRRFSLLGAILAPLEVT
jgi:hypothetical protein